VRPGAWSIALQDYIPDHRIDLLLPALAGKHAMYEEHDFGSFEVEGETIFFKIDYYDRTLTHHSPDPADPAVTERVITIMLADEY
jgi:hypothetical protein